MITFTIQALSAGAVGLIAGLLIARLYRWIKSGRYRQFWRRLCIMSGEEICEYCGSENVQQYGFQETYHRHYCHKCHKVTVVQRI